jgi:putative ABC transport system permease protein
VAVAGVAVGIAASLLGKMAIHSRFPTLPVQIRLAWVGYATAIAIAGALLGAFYPALKAAMKDPVEAIAYE